MASEIENIEERGLKSIEELNNCQVVRSEFLSPVFRPKVTLNCDHLVFSASCIRLFTDIQYVQLLIDPSKKRLVILPCRPNTKDALKWCNLKEGKSIPRASICKIFGEKLFEMMSWILDNRYKVQAIYQELEGQKLLVFNLDECEMVVPEMVTLDDGNTIKKRKRYFPQEWRESFGLTFEQHKDSSKVNINAHYLLSNTKEGTDSDFTFVHRELEGKDAPTAAEIITKKYRARQKKLKK